MEDTIHDHLRAIDFKKRPVIPGPHAVFREMVAEAFHIAAQVFFQPAQTLHHPCQVRLGKSLEVLPGFGLEFDAVFHGRNRGTEGRN